MPLRADEKIKKLAAVFMEAGFKPQYKSEGEWAKENLEGRIVFHFKTRKKGLLLIELCAKQFPLITQVNLSFYKQINRYVVTVYFWNKNASKLAKNIAGKASGKEPSHAQR